MPSRSLQLVERREDEREPAESEPHPLRVAAIERHEGLRNQGGQVASKGGVAAGGDAAAPQMLDRLVQAYVANRHLAGPTLRSVCRRWRFNPHSGDQSHLWVRHPPVPTSAFRLPPLLKPQASSLRRRSAAHAPNANRAKEPGAVGLPALASDVLFVLAHYLSSSDKQGPAGR